MLKVITSETLTKLLPALLAAQQAFTPVPKNKTANVKTKTGASYSYKYADLADVLHMALPVLNANGIMFSQPHVLQGEQLRVVTHLFHSSGEWIQSDGILVREHDDPQVFGSSSTYMRRYDACSLLGIAPDEDTDGSVGEKDKTQPAFKSNGKPQPTVQARAMAISDAQYDDGRTYDEDPVFDQNGDMVPATKVPPPAPPRYEPPSVKPASGPTISDSQAKRWFAICKKAGKTEEEMKGALQHIGAKRSVEIPKSQYETFCEWAAS